MQSMLNILLSPLILLFLNVNILQGADSGGIVYGSVDELIQACRKSGSVGSLSAVLERNKADLSAASYAYLARQVTDIEIQESKLRADIEFIAAQERLAKSLLKPASSSYCLDLLTSKR